MTESIEKINCEEYVSDLLDRIVNINWTGSIPISETLSYDQAGNITQVARENGASTVAYDAIDQLVSSTGQYSKSFQYDFLGNRIGGTDGAGNFVSNFLTSNANSSFLADGNGFGDVERETTGSTIKNYTYRPDGKIASFQSGSTQVVYYYDALDRLIAKSISTGSGSFIQVFVHLGLENRVLLARAGDGSVTTYIDGQGISEHLGEVKNGVGKGYLTDHLGSVLNSDVTGASHSFGLFGEVSSAPTLSAASSPVNYGWQGLNFDLATKNWDNLARQYNQNTGTFTSQDPSGISGGINFYGSRKNNPLTYSDPNGQTPIALAGALIGAGINGYQAYKANGSGRQIAASATVGFISGGLAGLTGGLAWGVAASFSAGMFNNAANQLIFSGKIDDENALKAGATSAVIGGIGYGVASVANRYVYEIFSESVGFTAGTILEMYNDGGIPNDHKGNTMNSCPARPR